jgi:hypothetical protein
MARHGHRLFGTRCGDGWHRRRGHAHVTRWRGSRSSSQCPGGSLSRGRLVLARCHWGADSVLGCRTWLLRRRPRRDDRDNCGMEPHETGIVRGAVNPLGVDLRVVGGASATPRIKHSRVTFTRSSALAATVLWLKPGGHILRFSVTPYATFDNKPRCGSYTTIYDDLHARVAPAP